MDFSRACWTQRHWRGSAEHNLGPLTRREDGHLVVWTFAEEASIFYGGTIVRKLESDCILLLGMECYIRRHCFQEASLQNS